jgi:hypothetical protein
MIFNVGFVLITVGSFVVGFLVGRESAVLGVAGALILVFPIRSSHPGGEDFPRWGFGFPWAAIATPFVYLGVVVRRALDPPLERPRPPRPTPPPEGGAAGATWWKWVVLGVGIAGLILIVALGVR